MPQSLRGFVVLALCWLAAGGCCCVNRMNCAGVSPDCGMACGVPNGAPCCAARCPTGGKLPGALFRWANGRLTCGSGCGTVYWNEWMMDPPDCCDPCDPCGQCTGHESCCEVRRPARNIIMSLFARRYRRSDCDPCRSSATVLQSPDVAWDGIGSNLTPSCSRCGH